MALGLALAFLPYGWAIAFEQASLGRALGLGALAGLPLIALDPVLSDDLYRYLWDGHVLREGISPYRFAPDDPALAALRDEWWPRINHPEVPTIYPPLAQALFALSGVVAHAPWSFKLVALGAHLTTIPVVAALSGRCAPRAALGWALNPLVLSASALDGHIDAVLALVLAAAVLALVRGRVWVSAMLAGVASGIKLVGILIAPLLLPRRRSAAGAAAALVLLPLVPLFAAGEGSGTMGGLEQYARRWRGNAGPFVVLESATALGLSMIGDDARPGHVRLSAARPLLEAVQGTAWDPRAGALSEKKVVSDVAAFRIDFLAGLLARALAFALVLTLAMVLAHRRVPSLLAARWILLAALLLSPQVHPWYLLWLLPLELASGRVAGVAWSAAVLVAYAPLDGWLTQGRWQELPMARLLQYALVLMLIVGEELLLRRSPEASRFGPASEVPLTDCR